MTSAILVLSRPRRWQIKMRSDGSQFLPLNIFDIPCHGNATCNGGGGVRQRCNADSEEIGASEQASEDRMTVMVGGGRRITMYCWGMISLGGVISTSNPPPSTENPAF